MIKTVFLLGIFFLSFFTLSSEVAQKALKKLRPLDFYGYSLNSSDRKTNLCKGIRRKRQNNLKIKDQGRTQWCSVYVTASLVERFLEEEDPSGINGKSISTPDLFSMLSYRSKYFDNKSISSHVVDTRVATSAAALLESLQLGNRNLRAEEDVERYVRPPLSIKNFEGVAFSDFPDPTIKNPIFVRGVFYASDVNLYYHVLNDAVVNGTGKAAMISICSDDLTRAGGFNYARGKRGYCKDGHAVLVTDIYKDRNGQCRVEIQNSWGEDWGIKGRADLSYSEFNELMNRYKANGGGKYGATWLRPAGDNVEGVLNKHVIYDDYEYIGLYKKNDSFDDGIFYYKEEKKFSYYNFHVEGLHSIVGDVYIKDNLSFDHYRILENGLYVEGWNIFSKRVGGRFSGKLEQARSGGRYYFRSGYYLFDNSDRIKFNRYEDNGYIYHGEGTIGKSGTTFDKGYIRKKGSSKIILRNYYFSSSGLYFSGEGVWKDGRISTKTGTYRDSSGNIVKKIRNNRRVN